MWDRRKESYLARHEREKGDVPRASESAALLVLPGNGLEEEEYPKKHESEVLRRW